MENNNTTTGSKMRKITTTRTEARILNLNNEEKCYNYMYNDARSSTRLSYALKNGSKMNGMVNRFGGLPSDKIVEIAGIALDDRTKEVEEILAATAAYIKSQKNCDPECYAE